MPILAAHKCDLRWPRRFILLQHFEGASKFETTRILTQVMLCLSNGSITAFFEISEIEAVFLCFFSGSQFKTIDMVSE